MKPVRFVGSSLDDLRDMPVAARHALGLELLVVQYGGMPSDFKPMQSIGSGTYEIRYKDVDGAFRVIYAAKFKSAIYVLHSFQKKTQKTTQADIDLARQRYSLIQKMEIQNESK